MKEIQKIVQETFDGTTIEIHHTNDIPSSIIYPFFLKRYADLIDDKLTIPATVPPLLDCSAVYAILNNQVIGHIVYRTMKEHQTSSIFLSAVSNDFRGKGLYEIMHKHFEMCATIEGSSHITSWTHIHNKTRHRSAAKVGLFPKYVVLGKYIK